MAEINLYNSDCMEAMSNMANNQYDLAIVDPPYRNINAPTKDMRAKGGKMNNFGNKPDKKYFKELFRISKNQIIWGGNNFIENLKNTNCIIFWYKHQSLDNFSDGELAWTSFNSVLKVFDYPIYKHNKTNKIHPTQKPIQLYKWLLMNYAKQGDKILDTHGGSMSIAIACHDLGFDLDCYEIDKEYYDMAVKRFEIHKAQLRLF